MGLDMWMYGIKDITKDDIPDGMPESWYEDNGYKLIVIDYEDDEFNKMYNDLLKYAVTRNVIYIETDYNKLKKDYGIDEEMHLCYWGNNKMGFSYREFYKEIELTHEELDKYDINVARESLVFKGDELAYWRKEYNLQDLIYENYNGDIYNCGFHELDDELMKKINRYLKRNEMNRQNINDIDYVTKMYHEWY